MDLCNNLPVTTLENEYLILQDIYMKGDDVQKLSVIQALPQLLQYDPNATLTRILPKIQQELPKSSCEFHIATSKIFRLLIEKQLPLNLMNAVLQGAESKDPVVSSAWTETLLAVIPIVPVEQVKNNVLPLALSKSQPSSPVYNRVTACKILGKISVHPKMESIDVKTNILPAVQSLCQDCFQDVRATMCSQLHFIAQGLGDNLIKSSLLPNLVELASDDNMAVRAAAVTAVVLVIPSLNKQTKLETIVPLIKQLCQRTTEQGDITYPTIAREFGKILDALQNDIDTPDCVWLLQYYKSLATKGRNSLPNREGPDIQQSVMCREQCAFNLPAVTFFTMCRIPDKLELWHSVFSDLANDPCYLVRKTTAGCIHEITKVLGPQCKFIRQEIVKLLRDDAEEVLHMLVPNLGMTLELLCNNGVLSRETPVQSTLEITRALLKCHTELSKGYNWRFKSYFLEQLEHLPNCMPSDFIHQHFSPVILSYVLQSRPKPVKSQATRTLLVFLRYNLKEIQRKWIRDSLINNLCYSKSCYTRHIFILMCVHAMELFSNSYFKKYFFEPLLALADDPVSNIRLCVAKLLPDMFRMLLMPDDRKLQTNMNNVFSKMEMEEKDKDVKDVLRAKLKEIRAVGPGNKQEYMLEEKRKQDEENKILQGKAIVPMLQAVQSTGKGKEASHVSRDQTPSRSSSRSSVGRSASVPSRVVRTPSLQPQAPPSDMSFLEQHFYIDAGINLPPEKIGVELENALDTNVAEEFEKKVILYESESSSANNNDEVSTLSVENTDIETMTENDLKVLESSTTNITDDIKVNLRERNKKGHNKESPNFTLRSKRYSSVFPTTHLDIPSTSTKKKTLNRRSLHVGSAEISKIPVCLKKSKSNADVKSDEAALRGSENSAKNTEQINSNICLKARIKSRPKSEILTNSGNTSNVLEKTDLWNVNSSTYSKDDTVTSIKSNVPTNSIRSNSPRTSALPVFKRRAQSQAPAPAKK